MAAMERARHVARLPGMILRLSLVLSAALLVVGCNLLVPPSGGGMPPEDPGGTPPGPIDGEWRLVAGEHGGEPLQVPGEAPITMSIAGREIGGRAACNSYGGTVLVEADAFSIGDLALTEMACDPPTMEAESGFMAALAEAAHWARHDDALTLTGDAVELRFELVPPVPDADLTGTVWTLDALLDGEVVSSTVGPDPATLRFEEDGSLSGTTGCRQFTGGWQADGSMVTVSDLVVDDRACGELAGQDEHVLAVLDNGFEIAIAGERLTLSAGRLGLTYGPGAE